MNYTVCKVAIWMLITKNAGWIGWAEYRIEGSRNAA